MIKKSFKRGTPRAEVLVGGSAGSNYSIGGQVMTGSDDRDFEGQVLKRLDEFGEDITDLKREVERFNDRFTNYQQATQWVVQLAFTLIASATLTVIITSVLKR